MCYETTEIAKAKRGGREDSLPFPDSEVVAVIPVGICWKCRAHFAHGGRVRGAALGLGGQIGVGLYH